MNRRRWARALSRLFPRTADAAAFLEDALDDAWRTDRWRGVLRVTRIAVRDALATRVRPDGLPVTAPRRRPRAAAPLGRVAETILQDLRLGVRQLRRNKAYAVAAIATLALGIGANTAIFSVAWQSMLKPLPYPKSGQLVEVWETVKSGQHNLTMPAKFHDVRRESRLFSHLAGYGAIGAKADVTGLGDPEQWTARRVTGEYFDVFGMPPLVGRPLTANDVAEDSGAVVISEKLWRRRFGASPSVVGTTFRLNGAPGRVVGVMPDAFAVSGGREDVFLPMGLPPESLRQTGHYLRVVGRLREGVTPAQADAEVRAIAANAAARYPATDGKLSAAVESLSDGRATESTRSGLIMLALAAGAVWLMTCANLAGLQLARGVARAQEFGVRAALGASRARVFGQLLTEGSIIAVAGAGGGVIVGGWVLGGLTTIAPESVAPALESGPDAAVVAFALALGFASALVFSCAPAWRAARTASHWLRQRVSSGDRQTARLRLGLVSVQVASAFALLVGATFLVSSLLNVRGVHPGFRADGVLAFDVSARANPERPGGRLEANAALFRSIIDAVKAVPGVTSVCATNEIPFDPQFNMTYVPDGASTPVGAFPRTITPECFDTFDIPITRGRGFTSHESARVAIVTASFAARAWPGADPLGQRLHEGVADGAVIEVVGVAADTRELSLERRPYPVVYEAWTPGASFPPQRVAARTSLPPASLFPAVRTAVRRVSPDQAVGRLRALSDMIDRSLAARRFDLTLLGSFAGVALVLALVGVYGLLSQLVAQRTREIGVRLALGASPGSVVRLMLGHAGRALAIGLPVGLGGALLAGRLLRGVLFGVSAGDPRIYVAIGAGIAAAVAIAAWIPSRRAARVAPSLANQ